MNNADYAGDSRMNILTVQFEHTDTIDPDN